MIGLITVTLCSRGRIGPRNMVL